jgi:nucleotide-binding universal stress UspA family protein
MTNIATCTRTGVNNILYVTDFSQPSEAALPFAIATARKYGARIHALHALLPVPCPITAPETIATSIAVDSDIARADMQKVEAKLAEMPHDATIARGPAVWKVIEQAVKDSNADLIVLGTHGRTGALKFLMGSVAEEILRRSPVPVVTIGPAVREVYDGDAPFQPRRVLFATDFTPDSFAAAPYAIKLAQESHARMTLLHVLRSRDRHSSERQPSLSVAEAIHHLYETVPKDADLWCTPDVSVEYGEPARKILEVAEQRYADLIVMGARDSAGRLGAATHLSHNTVHKVVASARCPVVTVRGPSYEPSDN